VAANPARTLTAAGAGLAVATAAGIAWGFFPDWQFYWALLLGFGTVETMVRLLTKRQGFDLQAIAIAIVVYGIVLSRVVLAQRVGVNLADIQSVGPLVQRVLYLRPVPDLLFALLPVVVAWIRFR
jgi:hypothetical protein